MCVCVCVCVCMYVHKLNVSTREGCHTRSNFKTHTYLPNPSTRHRCVCVCVEVKLGTVAVGDLKVHFSIATTLRCREERYSFPWIAPLYPRYVLYNGEY